MDEILFTMQKFTVDDSERVWVHAFPYRTYEHPLYGTVTFTREDAKEMQENFTANVMEQELSFNYEHGLDKAKGNMASGSVTAVDVRDDGMWIEVEPTKTALQEIRERAWKYASVERFKEWVHPASKKVFKNVLRGGAFTNYPFNKGVAPLNFSELALLEKEPSVVPDKEQKMDLKELAKRLGLPEAATEADVNAKLEELAKMPAAVETLTQEFSDYKTKHKDAGIKTEDIQKFKDVEPELYAEILASRHERLDREAEKFSDNFTTEDGRVLSPEWSERVKQAYLKHSAGEMTMQEFSATMLEANTKGLVKIGRERGSARREQSGDQEFADVQKMVQQFADLSLAYSREHKVSYDEAMRAVGLEKPELADAYDRIEIPVLTGGGDE
jgi:phage I-like protein